MLLGLLGREGDVEDAVGQRAPNPKPAVGEHAQHPVVLAQHVGLELGDAVRPRDDGEVLQQQRPETATLEDVSYDERHLGAVGRPG